MQKSKVGLLSLLGMILGTVYVAPSEAKYDVKDSSVNGVDAMEELALIMASVAAGQELTAKAMARSVECIEEQGWSKDLTLSRLNDMITIFMGSDWGYVPPKTYIFAPHCPMLSTKGHVYISGSGNHAEDNMIAECGLPNQFYLTSAPCPDCAMMLLGKYHNIQKPTINIARSYIGPGKSKKGNKNVNKLCLAMLVQAGFQLVPWNWNVFENYITNSECRNAIAGMISRITLFNKRFQETKEVLDEVKNMAKSGKNYYNECNHALG